MPVQRRKGTLADIAEVPAPAAAVADTCSHALQACLSMQLSLAEMYVHTLYQGSERRMFSMG